MRGWALSFRHSVRIRWRQRAEVFLAHTDIIVLGAGIVGTSIAAHLAKRGLSVALVDRGAPGEGTSYGNAGVIEGNTVFPAAFPSSFAELARIALKRSPVANYHLAFLPQIAPWLLAFRAASQPARLIETAQVMRPLLARAVAEHEALAADAGADRHLSRRGWLKLYRTDRAFAAQATELDLAARFGIANVRLDRDTALALEPALNGIFRHAVHWTGAVSVDNPLALTRAYAARFAALGGLALTGDARSLHRADRYWRVETAAGPLDAGDVVIALGPWTPDVIGSSASNCRSPSSAAITGISGRAATPRSAGRCSIRRRATCWRRWSRASASLRGSSSPLATRRRRRFSSIACCRRRGRCFRSMRRSSRSLGWGRDRVLPIRGQ